MVEEEEICTKLTLSLLLQKAIFASWAFLSLDLPRSTLLDVTDSLALPAFRPEQSVNYHYRNAVQHPRFDAASLCTSLSSSLSLLVKLIATPR